MNIALLCLASILMFILYVLIASRWDKDKHYKFKKIPWFKFFVLILFGGPITWFLWCILTAVFLWQQYERWRFDKQRNYI